MWTSVEVSISPFSIIVRNFFRRYEKKKNIYLNPHKNGEDGLFRRNPKRYSGYNVSNLFLT